MTAVAKITQADMVRAIKAAERRGMGCEFEIKQDGSTVIRFINHKVALPSRPKPGHTEVDWDDLQA